MRCDYRPEVGEDVDGLAAEEEQSPPTVRIDVTRMCCMAAEPLVPWVEPDAELDEPADPVVPVAVVPPLFDAIVPRTSTRLPTFDARSVPPSNMYVVPPLADPPADALAEPAPVVAPPLALDPDVFDPPPAFEPGVLADPPAFDPAVEFVPADPVALAPAAPWALLAFVSMYEPPVALVAVEPVALPA
jgi:hypothetical protein